MANTAVGSGDTEIFSRTAIGKGSTIANKGKPLKAKSTSGLDMYLKYTSKSKIRFPVIPEGLTVESPFGVNKIAVAHTGEFTTIGFRGLRSIEFSTFFPKNYNASYCRYKMKKSPEWYRKQIEIYRGKRKPLTLIITKLKICMKVVIEDYSYEFKGGETGDIYFTLKLVEYKAPPSTLIKKKKKTTKKTSSKSTKKKTTTTTKARAKNTKYSVKKGQTHTVKRGDTLQKIAKKYYGVTTKWRDVYTINRSKIGANPDRIYPGQKLVIRKK